MVGERFTIKFKPGRAVDVIALDALIYFKLVCRRNKLVASEGCQGT